MSVWVWFAFSILGFTFLNKTETFVIARDHESDFLIKTYPEDFLPHSSVHEISTSSVRLNQRLHQTIATFNAEIYTKTSTINKEIRRIKFQARTQGNGSPTRPIYISPIPARETSLENTKSIHPIFQSAIRLDKGQVIDPGRIRLTFSDFLDPATVIFPENYEVSGNNPKEIILLENHFELDLVLSKDLVLGKSIVIKIKKIRGENGEISNDLELNLLYNDGIEDIQFINYNTLLINYKETATSLDPSYVEIMDEKFSLETVYDPLHPDLHLLKISPKVEAEKTYQIKISGRMDEENIYWPGSYREIILDRTPPRPVQVELSNEHEIIIHFDEPMDEVMSIVSNHYEINGIHPQEVSQGKISNQMLLTFEESLKEGNDYKLNIKKVEDIHGNAIEADKINFLFKKTEGTAFKELVINEVMAAPRAGNTLPNVEYVELLNVSSRDIALGGFRLHNSRSGTSIPQDTLKSGEYLILCRSTQKVNFEPYGKVIGLTNWPTLLNAGDNVKLFDQQGNVVDSLSYNNSNYGSTDLARGGYSLEIINPFYLCQQSNNLKPSISPMRGTPGQTNSIFDDTPDRIAPKMVNAIGKADQIIVKFSEPLALNLSNAEWDLSPPINMLDIQFINPERTEISLALDSPLAENVRYTLLVSKIRDCSGNLIDPGHNQFSFRVPSKAGPGEIIINEILFNPHTGTPKFVELYNSSNNYINLKNWKLGNESAGDIANRRVIAGQDLILEPNSYLAITTNADLLIKAYPKSQQILEMASLPSYPIKEGTVYLLDPEEELIEKLYYHENFHHPLLKEARGVSLERIDPTGMPNESRNWTSASGAIGHATPGFKNSQLFSAENSSQGITVSPEVFAPDAVGSQTFTTIQYNMKERGFVGTIKIFDISGKLIKDIIQNEVWGTNGFYIWNGTDLEGKKVRAGYYIIWLELLSVEGKVINIKKSVVVGSYF